MADAGADPLVLGRGSGGQHRQLSGAWVARWQAAGELSAAQAAIAKNTAVDVLERIAHDAVQVHGAHGCVEPSVVERIYRDARLLGIGGGAREVMLEIIGRTL